MDRTLQIKVIPQAKKNNIKQEGEVLKVYLTAPALDGRANEALIEFLSGYFKVKKNRIEIVRGLKARKKVVKIHDV